MRSARQQNAGTSSQPQGDWIKEESEIDKSQFDAEVIASRAQSTDPLIGKVLFGTYKVESVLGEGAMGIVYKAKQLAFNRHVALKTIKTNDPAISNRFTQEVRVHAQLKHENIVEAIDCLIAPNEQPFFVMEFLQGLELEDLIQANELASKPFELADIIKQIARALDFAHEKGVVHRDLKPGNIVILEQEGKLVVKVVDFGIAKIQEDIQKLTKTGQALGSPLYMSPEQCMGEELDGRSDIYSLGILLYECVTGELPFQGPNLVETMKLHCDPDVKAQPMNELVPDLPCIEQLDSVVQKCLDFFPQNRYQTCAELIAGIDFWIESVKNNKTNRHVPGTSRRIGKATKVASKEKKTDTPKKVRPSPPARESSTPPKRQIEQPGMTSKSKSSLGPAIVTGLVGGLLIMVFVLVTALVFMKEKVDDLKETPKNETQTKQMVEPQSQSPEKPKAVPVESVPVKEIKPVPKPKPKPRSPKTTTTRPKKVALPKPKVKPKKKPQTKSPKSQWSDLSNFKD